MVPSTRSGPLAGVVCSAVKMIGSCALATEAGINTNNTTSTTPIFLIPHCASFYLWVVFTNNQFLMF
jgi:hypothetical protein